MTTSREIITLQLGNYSNYIGAHFWNLEDELACYSQPSTVDEVDRSVLFRTTEGQNGKLLQVPRLVLMDLTGALGTMSPLGTFHEDAHQEADMANVDWHGPVRRFEDEPIPKNSYLQSLQEEDIGDEDEDDEENLAIKAYKQQKLKAEGKDIVHQAPHEQKFDFEGKVRYFTDYWKTHVHHKSLYQLQGIHHGVNEFDYFTQGIEYTRRGDEMEEMRDRIRYFAEDCDSLQGFQLYVDTDTGFGGLAYQHLQELNDDYARKSIITYGCVPHAVPSEEKQTQWKRRRAVNNALSLAYLSSNSSLYIPVTTQDWTDTTMPLLDIKPHDWLHATAILGAAIHTASLPYRVSRNFTTMQDFCAAMAPIKRLNILGLSCAFPATPELPILNKQHLPHRERPDVPVQGAPVDPLYQSKSLAHFAPWGRVEQELDVLVAEWPVLRGDRVIERGGIRTRTDLEREKVEASKPRAHREMVEHKAGEHHATRQEKREGLTLGGTAQTRWEVFEQNLEMVPAGSRNVTKVDAPIAVPVPFPRFFKTEDVVLDASIVTELASSRSMVSYFAQEEKQFTALARGRHALLQFGKGDAGFEFDEWDEVISTLGHITTEYREVYEGRVRPVPRARS